MLSLAGELRLTLNRPKRLQQVSRASARRLSSTVRHAASPTRAPTPTPQTAQVRHRHLPPVKRFIDTYLDTYNILAGQPTARQRLREQIKAEAEAALGMRYALFA